MTKKPICKYFAYVVVGIAVCAFWAVPPASAAVNLGSSSWVWQNPLPQGNQLQGVACSLAGGSLNLNCIAVGDLGTIIFGTASGGGPISWTSRTSNTTQTLHAVACVPGSLNCFAVGDGGTILVTWDNGDTWNSRPSGTTAKLSGISCNTTGKSVNCFAVGTGPTTILATNDDGVTWFPQPLPPDPLLAPFAVSCPDANTCYAAGNSGPQTVILKTTNAGGTWLPTYTSDSEGVTGISCGSTTHCVAVNQLNGNAYWTTDGWTHSAAGQFPPVPAGAGQLHLLGVSCWDAADCVAVGGGVQPNLYWTNNAGQIWQGEPSGTDLGLTAVSCSGATCLAVGYSGAIVTSYPFGLAYRNVQTTVTNGGLKRVTCVDTNHCWAVGDAGIFATSDGGTTWANQYSTPGLLAISCPSTNACFAVGGNLILGTTDGKTWNTQPPGTTAVLRAINCPSTTTCFAAGQGIILATTDGGKQWNPSLTSSPFFTPPDFSGIVCPSTVSCIAVADNFPGYIVTAFDVRKVNPWTQVPPSTPYGLLDVSCESAYICIAVGLQGTSLITTDFGQIGPNGQPNQHWSVQPPSTANLMGIGCDLDLGCYATTDDGYILSMPLAAGLVSNQEARVDTGLAGLSCAGVSGEDRCVAVGPGGTIVSKSIGPSSPDFSLDLQPLFISKSLVRGFNVIVRPLGPFNGTVTLGCNIPGAQSCTLNPTSVIASGTSLMMGPIALSDWNGATVTGTSGSLTHKVTYVYNPPVPPPTCKPGVCQ